jgi:hypothetical protein
MYIIPRLISVDLTFRIMLSGDYGLLLGAFTWGGTPQHATYWSRRSIGNEPISSLDRVYLLLCLLQSSGRVEVTPAASALLHSIAVENSWVR